MRTFKVIFKDIEGLELYSLTMQANTFEEAYEFAETHMVNVPDDSCAIELTEIQL
jgi:hypothetical protein